VCCVRVDLCPGSHLPLFMADRKRAECLHSNTNSPLQTAADPAVTELETWGVSLVVPRLGNCSAGDGLAREVRLCDARDIVLCTERRSVRKLLFV
jgi:hypothetical protein